MHLDYNSINIIIKTEFLLTGLGSTLSAYQDSLSKFHWSDVQNGSRWQLDLNGQGSFDSKHWWMLFYHEKDFLRLQALKL